MRKSILACTVSVLMSPVASWALGMGELQVNSSLNQALNAEIELHSVSKKDLDSLQIGLASKSAYNRADIDYSSYLSNFRFKIIQRGGKNYVTITTRTPFKEPYANFLMEAKWGSGRLLREYTMLVDPPEFVKMNARPVTTASTSRSTQVKRTTQTTPVETTKKPETTTKAVSTETTKKVETKKTESKKVETKKVVETDYVLSSADSSVTNPGELVYGPTKRNDTLWDIAEDMAPAHVSTYQMMMALLRDNPEAFVDNNVNNLKSGYVLRIKDPSTLTQLDHLAARRQVRSQYQTWQETRQQQVSSANIVDRSDRSSDDKAAKDGELKLVASGSKDSSSGKGSLAEEGEQLKEKLTLAGEELESKEVENQELRARIEELESIIETKTSLIELKDASLAALQKQKQLSQQEEGQQEESAEISEVDTTSEETVEATDITASDVTENIDPSVELSKDTEQLETSEPVVVAPIETESVTEVITEPEAEEKPQPEKKTEPVAQKPKPITPPEPVYQGVIDSLLSEENLPYTAGGGALVVLILAWLGLRGRGKKENEFEESILDSKLGAEESEFTIDDSEIIETEEPSTEVITSDTETSFLSDFSSDDMESLQPDDTEADPISEADVFMVYGRYQQAEELLKTAITQEPERLDYQMKLLEVYHGDNQKDAFAVQADVVRDSLKQSNDSFEQSSEWTKAKSWAEKLGVDIEMPDSFDEGLSVADISSEVDSSDELTLEAEDLSFDEDSTDNELELSFDESDNLDLDIDESLSLDSMEEDEGLELELDTLETEETSDFGDSLSLEEVDDTQSTDLVSDLQEDISEDTLDFETSLDLEDIDSSSDDEMLLNFDSEATTEADTLDLELEDTVQQADESSLELDLESEGLSIKEDSEIEESIGGLSLEDSVDDTLATAQDDELDLLDDDMDFDDLDEDFPELDAVGTKLDLAKAYIDMGDMESASSILNEVIDEGNDDQKSQAQALLNQTA